MRSLLARLGRHRRDVPTDSRSNVAGLDGWGDWVWPVGLARAVSTGLAGDVDERSTPIGTLGAGPIADVDRAGAIADRRRPASVDFWIRHGDRWLFPSRQPNVRQRRIDGLPIVETTLRIGEGEVVLTAFADEGGDGKGRVVISIDNRVDEMIAVGAVVRPFTRLGRGRVSEIRVVERLVVVDGTPMIELPRPPIDIVTGSAEHGDVHHRLADELVGDRAASAHDGSATLAAIWPIAAGSVDSVVVIDGRTSVESPPTSVDRVLGGWHAQLAGAAEFALPGRPDTLTPRLVSSLLLHEGSVGSDSDAAVAIALALVGLPRAAHEMLDGLLDRVAVGAVDRADWPAIAAACSAFVIGNGDHSLLDRHRAAVTACAGTLLRRPLSAAARRGVVAAVEAAAGPRAADDARSITSDGSMSEVDAARLGAIGIELEEPVPGPPPDGDDAYARAIQLIGLRSDAVSEQHEGLDLAPGFSGRWLGQNVDVARVPTSWGRVSFSIRWHGARPALLWEIEATDGVRPRVTMRSVDPAFDSDLRSGEALLAAPAIDGAER